MPPSGRSSSSRSSSSSSSSRSSSSSYSSSSHSYSSRSSSYGSSYGSSRSSVGFFKSGPSSHSSGTHRPSPHSASSHANGGVPIRERRKQPMGYNSRISGYQTPTTYHCRKHDYVYYASGWTDSNTGTVYLPGYYDENGSYYDEVAFKDKSSGILTMKCEYCDSVIKTKWTEGLQPTCPNCGAVLTVTEADEVLSSYQEPSYTQPTYTPQTKAQPKGKWHPVIMSLMSLLLLGGVINRDIAVILLAAGILIVTLPMVNKHLSKAAVIWSCVGIVLVASLLASALEEEEPNIDRTPPDSSYYVETLGRSCEWYDEYESYYDKETDCYFAYSDESGAWQYWYEGISSDYGDYGWMEYDEGERQWYIESSAANWVRLPSMYVSDRLWYISDNPVQTLQTEAVRYQNINSGSFYVEALGRSCEWLDEYETYYDEETDCYFWYNTDINPACWQYWYEGISSDFGDYGWMEYDEGEACWYIEASSGNWIVLPKGYNADYLWYIED